MAQKKSIKKVPYILLLLFLMLCIGACSKKGTKQDAIEPANGTITPEASEEAEIPEPTDTEKRTQEPEKESEDSKNSTDKAQFLYDGDSIDAVEFSDAFHNIAFDRPMYQVVSEGYTQVFNRGGSLFIAYSMLEEEHPELLAKDVMSSDLNKRFFKATDSYYPAYDPQLKMDSTEDKTINGVECMRFEGSVVSVADDKEFKNYAVGYTFIKDNIPCLLIGVVVEKDQTQLHKDEIIHNVDEMIKTLRDRD